MRKRNGRRMAFLLALGILMMSLAGYAAADSMHTEISSGTLEAEVLLGYDGMITYGKPVPIRVTVKNHGEDFEGIVAVNSYASKLEYDRYEEAISVPAGGERTVVLHAEAYVRQEIFTAEILKDGKTVLAVNAMPSRVINPSAMMIGVLSGRPRNLAVLDITSENDALSRFEYWQTVPLTPETLPEDPELLNAFGMIILDDVNPGLLTGKQQTALKDWAARGHILICGGGENAPENIAFLQDVTGLKAENYVVSDGVHAALEQFAGRRATNRKPEVTLAGITGGTPLVSDSDGNGLIWRTQTGAGCVYTLAWAAGDAALNAESLMHVFYQQMLLKLDSGLYGELIYSRDGVSALCYPGDFCQVPVRSALLPAVIILGAALVLGFGLWMIMKKRGTTNVMWAAIPLLAAASAAGIAMTAGASSLNTSAGAVTVNLVQNENGMLTRYTGITAAAARPGLHAYRMDGETLEVQYYSPYWEDEEEEAPKEPVTLRSVRKVGAYRESAVRTSSPWESTVMNAIRRESAPSGVTAEIWMEADGFHGRVTNGSAHALKAGSVVCVWGFVRIPALAPGESADFALYTVETDKPDDPEFTDGMLIRNANTSLYSVINQMFFGREEIEYESIDNIQAGMTGNAASQLTSDRSRGGGSAMDSATFLYSAEPEGMEIPALTVDGVKTESMRVIPRLTVEAKYLTVGKTGVVFLAPGMIPAVRQDVNGDGFPVGDMPESGYSTRGSRYYTLSENPVFRFTPETADRTEITLLQIGLENWYTNECKCRVMNYGTGQWEEVPLNAPLKNPEQYLNGEGTLYCQFLPASGESYMEIPQPTLMLEGRVRDAET